MIAFVISASVVDERLQLTGHSLFRQNRFNRLLLGSLMRSCVLSVAGAFDGGCKTSGQRECDRVIERWRKREREKERGIGALPEESVRG